jgi:DNA polymerase-3 subunit delta
MLPMMAQRRLVVVRGVDTWPAAELQSLSKYVPGMSPTTVLVMEARKLDERMAASKQLHAAVQHTVFVELQERDLYPWLVRQARQRGLELGRDVPETLVATIGTSLSLLSMAIERIDLFVGPSLEAGLRPVTLERMAPIIADGRARTVFELTDQVVAGNVGAAMDSLHRLLLAGDSPVGINAMLARQFRQFHQVSAGRRAGLSGEGLARFVGVPGFRLQDTLRAADAYGLATSEQAIHLLMQTDRLLKSSRLKDTIIVERAILQLCMARRTNLTA